MMMSCILVKVEIMDVAQDRGRGGAWPKFSRRLVRSIKGMGQQGFHWSVGQFILIVSEHRIFGLSGRF
jgi:hypothetical protein